MKKNHSTKRTLIGSMMSLVLCITMLLGTTLAWFTDTASTSVHKIESGKLKVALIDKEGNPLTEALTWVKASGHKEEEILWEPGAEYHLPVFRIKNDGNLALKYKLQIAGIEEGDEKLLEVLDFTFKEGDHDVLDLSEEGHLAAGETSEPITISAKMQETAGNEYQGMTVNGIAITVIATQDTVENDSYGNTYDENAAYPAYSQTELDSQLENATDNTVIAIPATKSMKLSQTSVIKKNVILSGAGPDQTVLKTEDKNYLVANDNVTIKNITIDGTGSSSMDDNGVIKFTGNNAVLDNVKVIGGGQNTYGHGVRMEVGKNGSSTIKNSVISGAFRGIQSFSLDGTLKIENTTLAAECYCLNVDGGTGKLVINKSTLMGWTSYTDSMESATFTDCTFEVNKNSYGYNCVRGYTETTFVNCDFGDEFWFGAANTAVTVTFENCRYKGTLITTENVNEILEPDDNEKTNVVVK